MSIARADEWRPSRGVVPTWRPGDRALWYALVAPAVVIMLAFYVYPLSRVLWMSVTEPVPGLGNYAQLGDPTIVKVALTTVRICGIASAVTLVLSYIVAYCITQSSARTRGVMLICVLLPLWVSALVRSFAWIALLRREGLANGALLGLGVIEQPMTILWSETAVLIGIVHYMLPYGILPLAASMGRIDRSLMVAARGLGASPAQAFLRVFAPLSLRGVAASGIIVLTLSLGFYVTPALLGGGRTIMLTEFINVQVVELVRWGTATMLATCLLATVLLLVAAVSILVHIQSYFADK
jgi:putative spermidine/putrescine transport system permease protein